MYTVFFAYNLPLGDNLGANENLFRHHNQCQILPFGDGERWLHTMGPIISTGNNTLGDIAIPGTPINPSQEILPGSAEELSTFAEIYLTLPDGVPQSKKAERSYRMETSFTCFI